MDRLCQAVTDGKGGHCFNYVSLSQQPKKVRIRQIEDQDFKQSRHCISNVAPYAVSSRREPSLFGRDEHAEQNCLKSLIQSVGGCSRSIHLSCSVRSHRLGHQFFWGFLKQPPAQMRRNRAYRTRLSFPTEMEQW